MSLQKLLSALGNFRNDRLVVWSLAIIIPDNILANYLSAEEIQTYKSGTTKITSITVYAEKPAKDDRNCCEPGSSCC